MFQVFNGPLAFRVNSFGKCLILCLVWSKPQIQTQKCSITGRASRSKFTDIRSNKSSPNICCMFSPCSFSLMLPQHVHTTLKQSLYSSTVSDSGSIWRCGLVSWSVPWQVFRSSKATCIFWMSSWLLYYCFIYRVWTNYFNSPLHWGADWQLPTSEWSVRFSDLAQAIWCILTIIGATATMMFSKPLCYFPGGCPRGIFE